VHTFVAVTLGQSVEHRQ